MKNKLIHEYIRKVEDNLLAVTRWMIVLKQSIKDEEENEGKSDCSNCRHGDVGIDNFPCNRCVNFVFFNNINSEKI